MAVTEHEEDESNKHSRHEMSLGDPIQISIDRDLGDLSETCQKR